LRTLPALLFALPLTGCHLFASGEIEKTCDDIPGCAAGTVGTDTDTSTDDTDPSTDDTATTGAGDDTGTTPPTDDTGPIGGERLRGLVLFGVNLEAEQFGLWIHDPDDGLVHELFFGEADVDRRYAMAWDDAQGRFFVAFNEQVTILDLPKDKKGDDIDIEIGDVVLELKIVGGEIWVIGEETLGRLKGGVGTPAYELIATGEFTELSGGFFSEARRTIEVVDLDRSSPDLWALDITSMKLNRVARDFDDQEARSRLPFGGRDDLPWSCTSAGAVYDLSALQGGILEPERLIDLTTTDVIDCDYDAGSDEVIMFSVDAGVLRVDAAGAVDRFSLPAGYTLLSGAVW